MYFLRYLSGSIFFFITPSIFPREKKNNFSAFLHRQELSWSFLYFHQFEIKLKRTSNSVNVFLLSISFQYIFSGKREG